MKATSSEADFKFEDETFEATETHTEVVQELKEIKEAEQLNATLLLILLIIIVTKTVMNFLKSLF